MSTETDRLEREAESRRANVDATLDALRDRLSVNSIVDEVTTLVRNGNGADLARNFGRQVRDNPLALGLVGAGLAWLFAGPGVRDGAGNLRRSYDDWRYDRFEEAFPPDGQGRREADHAYRGSSGYGRDTARGYASDYGADRARDFSSGQAYGSHRPGTVGYTGPSGGEHGGPGLSERARDAASSAGSRISGAASSAASGISGAASSTADGISGAASSTADAVSGAARSAYDSASRFGESARDAAWRAEEAAERRLRSAGDNLAYAGRRVRRSFLDTMAEEPLVVGAVALAIGAAIGAAIPSTRREDELFGDARDRLRDEAYAYGREAMHRAESVAEKTYQAASEEAEKKGLKPTGEGETLAEKVGSVARTAVETARAEVKNETQGARGDQGQDKDQGQQRAGGTSSAA